MLSCLVLDILYNTGIEIEWEVRVLRMGWLGLVQFAVGPIRARNRIKGFIRSFGAFQFKMVTTLLEIESRTCRM